jgi:hypothetical protein
LTVVDLSAAPNRLAKEPTEPNFDADATLLMNQIGKVIEEHRGRFHRCVVSLDAPLEAKVRSSQNPRVKAAPKGAKTGSKRRECEDRIQEAMKTLRSPAHRQWHTQLKIQSGSPIPVRLSRILDKLSRDLYFSTWGTGRAMGLRDVIEIFPSEAIWSLGISGFYGDRTSEDVRAYKTSGSLSPACALDQARSPLLGFGEMVERQWHARPPVRRWIEQIAEHARNIALSGGGDLVRKGKGFDDPIESGIAFFTSVAFAANRFHAWGDGSDGTIVGPGGLSILK